MSTKKTPPPPRPKRRKKAPFIFRSAEYTAAESALKRLEQGADNGAEVIAALGQLQTRLEGGLGCTAYVIYPDKPLPPELVERAAREFQTLNASEALYGFIGWLTTRDQPVILSAHHTAGVAVELVKVFAQVQGLAPVRDTWDNSLTSMRDVATTLTNDPALNPKQFPPPPPTAQEAFDQLLRLFAHFSPQRQNHLLARLLDHIKEDRQAEHEGLSLQATDLDDRLAVLSEAREELEDVLGGNFTIVPA